MKTNFVFLSLFFVFGNLIAQNTPNMAAEGNVWAHEDYIYPYTTYEYIYTTYYFTQGDTILDGKEYSKVYTTSNLNSEDTTYHIGIRQEGDSVFVYGLYGNNERLAYRFNVALGDTLQVGNGLGEEFYHIVSGIDSLELLNGTYRKRIYIDLYMYFQGVLEYYESNAEIWVEGIGAVYGCPLWSPLWTGFEVFEFIPETLFCFSDTSEQLYIDEMYQSCDVLITDVSTVSEEQSVFVYPNPVNDFLNIELITSASNLTKIRIWNMQGALMFENNVPATTNTEVSVYSWPAGIYLLQIDLYSSIYYQLITKIN